MKKTQDQAEILRQAMTRLKKTRRELAQDVGVSLPTMTAWMAPATAAKHRKMPETARRLLAAIMAAKRK